MGTSRGSVGEGQGGEEITYRMGKSVFSIMLTYRSN